MNYKIKGNLCGFLCEECTEPIFPAEVLLYLPWQNERVQEATVASTKETFRLVSKEEKNARKNLLVATAKTDENGNFEFSVDEKYAHTAFDIDFVCGTVPRIPPKAPRREPVQFHLTTFYPQWRIEQASESYYYIWKHCIISKWWCYIRGYYFDAWVICGHLRNCETGSPIANATVTAWDADFLTDDNLGSATTDAGGHFRIDYTSIQFKQTFLSPWINVETDPATLAFNSGPDVYFKASIGGVTLIDETSANKRNNVGYCLCVDLCTKINVGETDFPSAWTGIGTAFNISTGIGPKDFDPAGYAGSGKYALSSVIRLTGQAAPKAASGNPIEYRFRISDVTTPNGGAAPGLANFTKIIGVTPGLFVASTVAKLMEKVFPFAVYDVISDQADFDAEGWFDINSAIARTLVINGLGSLSNYWFIDEDTLIALNTTALTTAPNVAPGIANAGDVFPAGSKIPIEKVAIRFEIREVVNKPANIFNVVAGSGKTLNSAIINNNSSFIKFAIQELQTLGDCSPVSGTLHAKYTVHHPHLQSASINVHNNSWTINKGLSDGFIPLSGNTNAAVNAGNNNSLQINDSPNDLVRCTYAITIYVYRRLHSGDSQISHEEQQILFFYDI